MQKMSKKTFIKKEDRPEIKLDAKISELSVKELMAVFNEMAVKSIIHDKNVSRDVKPIKERIKEFKHEKPEWKGEIKEWKEYKEFKEKPEKEMYEGDKRMEIDPGFLERLPEIEQRIELLSKEIAELKKQVG